MAAAGIMAVAGTEAAGMEATITAGVTTAAAGTEGVITAAVIMAAARTFRGAALISTGAATAAKSLRS
jgi:hypothetical protein